MYWSFWGDLELLSEGWLMRALAGAGHGKRECVLLSGGVPTEGGGLEFPFLDREYKLCLLSWSLGFEHGQHRLE